MLLFAGILSQKDVSLLLEEVQSDLNRLGLVEWCRVFASRLSLMLQNWLWGESIEWRDERETNYDDIHPTSLYQKSVRRNASASNATGMRECNV